MQHRVVTNALYFVKSETGAHYMCPADVRDQTRKGRISDKELRRLCVADADRPYND
jgi:hypothetical protein